MSAVVHVIAIGITGLGLLLCIISTATKHWYESELNNVDYYIGLWESCQESLIVDTCSSITLLDGSFFDKFRAVRAFTIMAILAFALAGLSLILTIAKRLFLWIFFLGITGAAVCQMIGMSIYTDLYNDQAQIGNFGWSFALGWAGFVLALISLGVGVIFKFATTD